MTMPRFTAEAALYQTNGQYRTGKQVIHSSPRTISPIYPAVIRGEVPIDVPGEEKIPVHSCAPGWIDIGGMCWPAPLTEPSSGGGSGAPGGGNAGSGPGGGVGGGPMTPPKKPPKERRFNPTEGGKCNADEMRKDKNVFIARGKYAQLPGGIWQCCDTKSPECILCQPEGSPIVTSCADEWPI
jgi:hypothetical protein